MTILMFQVAFHKALYWGLFFFLYLLLIYVLPTTNVSQSNMLMTPILCSVLYSSDYNLLISDIVNSISSYYSSNILRLNMEEMKIMSVNKTGISLYINKFIIQYNLLYSGIVFNCNMNWNSHFKRDKSTCSFKTFCIAKYKTSIK